MLKDDDTIVGVSGIGIGGMTWLPSGKFVVSLL